MVKHQHLSREERIARNIADSQPILVDLRRQGIQIDSLRDLVNTAIDYRSAIPSLIDWLGCTENLDIKETLVRALTVKWARPIAARPLIREFLKAPDSEEFGLKWAIGNALSVAADDSVFDDIVALVKDKRHGRAREMLAVALANMKNPKAVDVLIELLDDEEIAGHALSALRKLAPPEASEAIEPFVNHPKTWVRNEAKHALKKIDNKLARAAKNRAERK